jgi:hypothetical protein
VQEEKYGSLSMRDTETTQNPNVCLVQLNELSFCASRRTRETEYEVPDKAQQYIEQVGILTGTLLAAGSTFTDRNLHVV